MRIASLVPSATELLFALGLGDDVVAVTHECDFPPEAIDLPQLTASVIPAGLAPAEIDQRVRAQTTEGLSLYTLDEELLAEEEPDLIVAQQLCDVCAVSFDDVRKIADRLPSKPNVISLDPTTLGEVLGDIRTVSNAADCKDAGVDLLESLADRIDDVKISLRNVGRDGGPERVNVAALEWLDPPFVGGHWVPQMIETAGGLDLLGMPGERSREATWDEVRAAEPDVIVLMQCGYDTARAAEEALEYADRLRETGARKILACDASAYFSRPGPRLVDGLELLAHALHPALFPEPVAGRMFEVDLND
ncbi:MAG: ABC transporter substrate-binding protein [Solirubrobacterales bacterium]